MKKGIFIILMLFLALQISEGKSSKVSGKIISINKKTMTLTVEVYKGKTQTFKVSRSTKVISLSACDGRKREIEFRHLRTGDFIHQLIYKGKRAIKITRLSIGC